MRVIDTFRTVLSLAYSPCGRFLYSAGWEHVSRWDVFSGEEARLFHKKGSMYQQWVSVSPAGSRVGWVALGRQQLHSVNVTGGKTTTITLSRRQTPDDQRGWGFLHTGEAIQHTRPLAVDPSGRTVAFVQGNDLYLRPVPADKRVGRREVANIADLADPLRHVRATDRGLFGFAGEHLFWWHDGDDVVLHDLAAVTTQRLSKPKPLPTAVTPDGRTGIAAHNREVLLIDLSSGLVRERFNWDVGTVEAIAVAPDGMTVAVAGWAGGIAIFDLDG